MIILCILSCVTPGIKVAHEHTIDPVTLLRVAAHFEKTHGLGSLLTCEPAIWRAAQTEEEAVFLMHAAAENFEKNLMSHPFMIQDVIQDCGAGDPVACCRNAQNTIRHSDQPDGDSSGWSLMWYAGGCAPLGGQTVNGCFGYALVSVQQGISNFNDKKIIEIIEATLAYPPSVP
jgi:hypothetical protein